MVTTTFFDPTVQQTTLLASPRVQWVTAAALWQASQGDANAMRRPGLLRFASDQFMDELAAILNSPQPGDLAGQLARPESFRARPAGSDPTQAWNATAPAQLKLYQPVHGHFCLVAASLVCRLTGLPDKVVDTANGEKVGFVLRRLGKTGQEFAWVNDPAQGKGWQAIDANAETKLAAFEELQPMFPINYGQNGQRRRLLVGLAPTSSRDSFQTSGELSPLAKDDDPEAAADRKNMDVRLEEAEMLVLGPLAALRARQGKSPSPPDSPAGETEASTFLLLDFGDWLNRHMPDLWAQILNNQQPAGAEARDLYLLLAAQKVDASTTWLAAMQQVWAQRHNITGEATPAATVSFNLKTSSLAPGDLRKALTDFVGATLTPGHTLAKLAPPAQRFTPKLPPTAEVQYVIRCVYLCPACGPLKPDVVSEPTQAFSIAPFFDFDAPSRPIRIMMPVDTSIAGLRKFNKNVGFVLSDKLRSQMNAVTDLKQALDGNLASEQEFNLGLICSFSIPIITIVALILLIALVFVLNIVFWWVPFFRLCFPLNLKAKSS